MNDEFKHCTGYYCYFCDKFFNQLSEMDQHSAAMHPASARSLDMLVYSASKSVSNGKKYDENKARWDLVPYDALSEVVDILTHGAQKYGDHNWQKVDSGRSRYFAAMMRHLVAYMSGEKHDKESGKSHLAHAVCNGLFLIWIDKNER